MAKNQTKQVKKRKVRVEAMGEAHIGSSFNNIIISLTNAQGQESLGLQRVKWDSADQEKHAYAAQMAAEDCGKVALEAGLKKVKAYVKGQVTVVSAIRTLHNLGMR